MFKRGQRHNPFEFATKITPRISFGDALVKAYEYIEFQRSLRKVWEDVGFPHEEIACYGCTHGERCCVLIVLTTLAEGLVIFHQLNAMGRYDTIRALIAQGEQQAAFAGTELIFPSGEFPTRVDLWCDRQETCVLLDENNRCSIYRWAPFTCRAFFVAHDSLCVSGPICTTRGHKKTAMADYGVVMEQMSPAMLAFSNVVADGFVMPGPIGQMVQVVVDAWNIDVNALG